MEKNTSTIFLNRLPRRPYCSDDLTHGLHIRPTETALRHRHIQPNRPLEVAWLTFDIDYAWAAFAWEKANLPPPSITVINPENGHAHLIYGLTTPVAMSDAAREAPIRYAAAIQAAFLARLCADPGYAGLITKNPLHDSWRTLWVQHLYDLSELDEWVTLPKLLPRRESVGLGRNCILFDEIRAWAYQWIRVFKRNGASPDQWRDAVLSQASGMNQFDAPLASSEVMAISKSVSKWTWLHFSDAKFSALQSARGKRGGRPKTTTKNGAPWAALGISRSNYYHKLQNGLLVPE
ncbi:MAG: replication initiation protein [Gallionella sp.]